MESFDDLLMEVEVHLKCNEGRNRPLQILKAVNTVLFKKKGFIRSNPFGNPQSSYLDQIFIHGSGTGVMLSIIYMEICQRLGLEVNGAAVGQDFVVWPVLDGCAQMVFEPCKGGKSWMFEHNEISLLQRSALSEQSKSLPVSIGSTTDIGLLRSLEPASKRDILGIVLRNLKTVYWKRASRARPGLTISAPLQLPGAGQHDSNAGKMNLPVGALLRPQDLRRYSEAVQELSICMALAPVHEEAMLQPFVERLHLMRLAVSWGMLSSPNAPSALV
jgi:regulator of sirC expression with transglutaminase-like and TPR domain